MNKAILISIQPKWCELIASGEKTIEVRKTTPKLQTPFKCYIYETKAKRKRLISGVGTIDEKYGRGKVIGEFVCDKLYDITYLADYTREGIFFSHHGKEIDESQDIDAFAVLDETCLDMDDIIEYMGKTRECHGWHISDLKIYDEPKELDEFRTVKRCKDWQCFDMCSDVCGYAENNQCHNGIITKRICIPPQSWCYAEK